MSRYRNAAEIMKAIKQPVPCVATAHRATVAVLISRVCPEAAAAAIRFDANGAVRRSG